MSYIYDFAIYMRFCRGLNMITDKEYPATHSMATSWYCVDEDGNVGIFDIDDNVLYLLENIDRIAWTRFSTRILLLMKLNSRDYI